ncbi:AGE family epimerase/isomerase [Pseudomonas citronellolis]|uniref:AGE family epimerase/isomerase n=1 Tax=Pseudomonas citronellolis TaxID=53408 RepID=UPI00209DA16B|nr:AGE family epimerase/isomerase [Pseudomonas citronellolis]MCP1608305.1 mannose-6-phosphate isomerase [Pseudomonas citronellolis]MCP1659039.1 mannose-6-phosphate isomerase [Pseudomonas citronellolis]MCP1725991.1 mannose-6-phosphate isomerase [Pseudomonas citronellolis]
MTRHYADTVLPLWRAAGWNEALQLPYESLDDRSGQPLPAVRYRAMACARQLFVFSHAGQADRGRAEALFASLQRHFGDGHGAWLYSIDAAGKPLDSRRDLYTFAFVVFACAQYHKLSGSAAALELMTRTTELIEQRFADGQGLYLSALAEDFSDDGAPVLQNPIMHLTEAYLAAYAIAGDPWYGERLQAIGAAVLARFVDPASGCVAELPLGEAGNRIEPGHQFEWFSLVMGEPALFAGSALEAALRRAFAFAQRHGVAAGTLGVGAALAADGTLQDATQRIWAQTEFARALAVEGSARSLDTLTLWTERFRSRFLHDGGWHEVLGPGGEVLRADMPSTTPYHLLGAYQALQALVGRV